LAERLEGRRGSVGGGRRSQEGVVDDPDHPEGEHRRKAGEDADSAARTFQFQGALFLERTLTAQTTATMTDAVRPDQPGLSGRTTAW